MHHAGAQHLYGRADEPVVHRPCARRVERKIAEPRRGMSVGVGDELHEEDALDEVVGHRDADTRGVEPMDHVDLGRAPRRLVLLSTVLRPVGDGALVARVPDLAALGILGAMLEGAVLRVLVDLGDRVSAAGDDQVDVRFFSAHERAHDLIEDAVVEERDEAFRHTHGAAGDPTPLPRGHIPRRRLTAAGMARARCIPGPERARLSRYRVPPTRRLVLNLILDSVQN